jgi:hypothetical protein
MASLKSERTPPIKERKTGYIDRPLVDKSLIKQKWSTMMKQAWCDSPN